MATKDDWRTKRPTVAERTKFLFNNDLLSDVKFVVRKSDDNCESKMRKLEIPAHKFVLSLGSSVFETMFYGELPEKDSVDLPDCEYESLLELFRYMYSDEVTLSGSNVMGVLYLAKKYMVPSLADKCMKYLQDSIAPSNVFSILMSAQMFEERNLMNRCWKFIDKQTKAAVESEEFETIDRSLLEALVSRSTLTIKEVDLFQAIDHWATKQCEKERLTVSGDQKRRILGENVIRAIRFPLMKQAEFSANVLDKKILTQDEVEALFHFFSSTLTSQLEFSATRRSCGSDIIHRCCRFGHAKHPDDRSWKDSHNNDGSNSSLEFSADKDILLHGLRLFGSKDSAYTVIVEVKSPSPFSSEPLLVSKAGTFSSRHIHGSDSSLSYYGFDVVFDSAVLLKKNRTYAMKAFLSGPNSYRGQNLMRSVKSVAGVTFSFLLAQFEKNSTSEAVAELLFALKLN